MPGRWLLWLGVLALVLCAAGPVLCLDNGLGRTPQMGWNSWNRFGCAIDAEIVRQTADAIVARGLDRLGYRYVVVDDCWAYNRSVENVIQADPRTFPGQDAMKELAQYVHARGLKFGLYSDAGNATCAQRPGSLGYETLDANTYARWEVDYLKYDNCNNQGIPSKRRYRAMRDALLASGRPIFYSLCSWGQENVTSWGRDYGNSWRSTDDIRDVWTKILSNLDENDKSWMYAGPGGWNDPDMLEVGNGFLSVTKQTAHFSLWALVKAPLILGEDVRHISNETMSIIANEEVIRVNQDPLGVQGHKRTSSHGHEVWAGPLADCSVAVILFNRDIIFSSNITAHWEDIGLAANQSALVRDLWLHKDLGVMTGSVNAKVPSDGVVMFRITPVNHTCSHAPMQLMG